ncbi:MAG: methyl-accepting chemotaxis protein [Treponema sp.]|nr:methyl-accepting chemotaxis protein [Treponema sp.]
MQKKNQTEELNVVFNKLIVDYKTLRLSLADIYNQSQNIRVLSFNSAIEAARAGQAGSGFKIISEEIRNISEKNDAGSQASNAVVDSIEKKMYDLIGIRTADVAFDIIDKIDRNLFERYCDVQAWATFGKIIDACSMPSEETYEKAQNVLERMVRIYEVYHDAILTDMNGIVICAGVRKELRGADLSNREWFKTVCAEKKIIYSDMYYSSSRKTWAVAYTCPVIGADGSMIGVLSTRFNWQYILNIVDESKVSPTGEICVINSEGTVIASRNRSDILKRNLSDTEAFHQLSSDIPYGFCYTKNAGSSFSVFGFAHTCGYNSYPGKNWSVIIREEY